MELKGRVVVFSIVGCPHCLRAKNKLTELQLSYTDISLDSYPQMREVARELSGGWTTVPQIFFNEIFIGGNVELQELVEDEEKWNGMTDMLRNRFSPPEAPQPPDSNTAVDSANNGGEFICEPDDYAVLVREMKSLNIIKDHKSGLKTQKKSFKGQDFIDWLVKQKGLDESRALEMGQELISRKFGHQVKSSLDENTFVPDRFYRLLEDDDTIALNAGVISDCVPLEVNQLGETIRRLILQIFNDHISKDGKSVDYGGIGGDDNFVQYEMLTRELQRIDLGKVDNDGKLAFFINVYNALVIHATVKMGHPTWMWQRWKRDVRNSQNPRKGLYYRGIQFFNTVRYVIGGNVYSLQDIENGVLRANRKGVGMFSKPFGKTDPRLKIALEECEPMIHFALNCGAKSCPPIKTFSAKGIKSELKWATEAFLETDEAVLVDDARNKIKLSQIFKWYQRDFGGSKEEVVKWIFEHLRDGVKKVNLNRVIVSGGYFVDYLPYDWGHNGN